MKEYIQTRFTITKDQSIYIDKLLLEDKQKPDRERQYRGGRSEVVRKMIKEYENANQEKGFDRKPKKEDSRF